MSDLTEKIAEYYVLACSLKRIDKPELYQRANALSFELFMTMPAESYRALGQSIKENNPILAIGVMLSMRKINGAEGILTADDIIVHAPGIASVKERVGRGTNS